MSKHEVESPARIKSGANACWMTAAALDDLLIRWHEWQQGGRYVRGFASRALVVGEYRISRQYDDTNGALDDEIDNARSRSVDREVREMLEPWRTAVYVVARNLCTGVEEWTSPRLPSRRTEREEVVAVARQQLSRRLALAGLL